MTNELQFCPIVWGTWKGAPLHMCYKDRGHEGKRHVCSCGSWTKAGDERRKTR